MNIDLRSHEADVIREALRAYRDAINNWLSEEPDNGQFFAYALHEVTTVLGMVSGRDE